MRCILLMTLIVSALAIRPLSAQELPAEAAAWRNVAETVGLGASIALRLKDGRTVNGTLLEVRGDSILFKPRTRVAVPAADVRFTEIDSLTRRKPGWSPGAKVAVGVGTAVGAVLVIALTAIAHSGY